MKIQILLFAAVKCADAAAPHLCQSLLLLTEGFIVKAEPAFNFSLFSCVWILETDEVWAALFVIGWGKLALLP